FQVLPCFYSSCYSVPFAILNIHLLYRYWTIRSFVQQKMQRNLSFLDHIKLYIFLTPNSWFISCLYFAAPEDAEEIRHYQSLFRDEYEREINDGVFVMNYWRNGQLSIRPLIMLIIANSVEIVSFLLAATFASLTYRQIRKAQHLSEKIRAFQLRILLAATAQTLTPVIFVYIPYFFDVTISLFSLYSPTFTALSMLLLSCFPCVDAIVIIGLMKPYRTGLARILGRRQEPKTVEILPSSFT
ncbi:hypothetical protein PENTCL1PPCAC_7863, partial [Pristionchus entomophagus]